MSSTYIFIGSTGSIGSLYVELDRKAPKSKIVLPAANFQKSTNYKVYKERKESNDCLMTV